MTAGLVDFLAEEEKSNCLVARPITALPRPMAEPDVSAAGGSDKRRFTIEHKRAMLLAPVDDDEAANNARVYLQPAISNRVKRSTHAGFYLLEELYEDGIIIQMAEERRQRLLITAIGGVYLEGKSWRSIAHAGFPELKTLEKGSAERKCALNNLYRKEQVLRAAQALFIPPNSLADFLKQVGASQIIKEAAALGLPTGEQLAQPAKLLNEKQVHSSKSSSVKKGGVLLIGRQVGCLSEYLGRSLVIIDNDGAQYEVAAFLRSPHLAGLPEGTLLKVLEGLATLPGSNAQRHAAEGDPSDQLDLFGATS